MLCSIVPAISASPMLFSRITWRIRCCATIMSVMTSGSGPSSRTDPARTKSTPWSMADFITPDFS